MPLLSSCVTNGNITLSLVRSESEGTGLVTMECRIRGPRIRKVGTHSEVGHVPTAGLAGRYR